MVRNSVILELIAAMQKQYGKSWYKTATFVQQTTNFQPDGNSKVETWYEAMSVPGSLRIDFTPTSAGNGILQETQFNKYQKLGGGWMAPEVIFMVDGKVATTEKYSEIRGDVPLDPKLFDPQSWTTVHWKE